MERDVTPSDDLRQAIEAYERAVRRRHALLTPAATSWPRPSRSSSRTRLTVLAGVLLLAAAPFVTIRDSREEAPVRDVQQTGRADAPRSDPLDTGPRRIVLDPGHGGRDPGARVDELKEASVVLDVAARLEVRLKAETRLDVVLTRRDDVYLPLRARTELANRVGADLFLSIHANAARDRLAGGIATYHVDPSADDAPDPSRDFAESVQRHLIRFIREVHPTARDLGVKQAGFTVLTGANMPSALTEISFLTNQREAALLSTAAYRDQISEALLQSILAYLQGGHGYRASAARVAPVFRLTPPDAPGTTG